MLWRKCGWPKSSEIIVETLRQSLLTPVVTRWNSTFDAVARLLSCREQLDNLGNKLGFKPENKLSPTDVQYLEEYRMLMKPIAATIDFLQREENLLYGCLLPSLITLSNKLRKIHISSDMTYLKLAADDLEKNLRRRFSTFFDLSYDSHNAIIASVLTPKLKMRWFNALDKISSTHRTADDIHKIVIAEAVRHANANEEFHLNVDSSQSSNAQDDFYDFGDEGIVFA